MTNPLQILPAENPRLVVILAFDGVTLTDVSSPTEVFDLTTRYVLPDAAAGYRVVVTSVDGGPIRTSCGIIIQTESVRDVAIRDVDTLLVPGGGPPGDPPIPGAVVAWLEQNASGVKRICAICTGAFLVAAAGLANGRRITTHWDATNVLEECFPLSMVERDRLFVRDGNLWSSAGFSAGFDLSLSLVEDDFGYATAIEVARLLVVFLKRPGEQTQHSQPLAAQSMRDPDFSKLHAWIANNLTADLSIEVLAMQVGMTPRTFARRYVEQVRVTPAKTVEAFRTDAAMRRLREANASLKQVARECGFGDEQALRRAFIRRFGHPPSEESSHSGGSATAA